MTAEITSSLIFGRFPCWCYRTSRGFFVLEASPYNGFINLIVNFNKGTLTIFELDRNLINPFAFSR